MQSVHRIKENKEFRRIFQRGKSLATSRIVLYYMPNRLETFRVGLSVSKKVGNAVMRNHVKRLLRASFVAHEKELINLAYDFVIISRKPAAEATYQELENDVLKLLRRTKIMV